MMPGSHWHHASAAFLATALGCAPSACTAPPGDAPVAQATPQPSSNARWRRVRVQLLDVEGPYELRLLHESGLTLHEGAAPAGLHVVDLPPGPCVASIRRIRADGTADNVAHAFTVTESKDQSVEWAVPLPR